MRITGGYLRGRQLKPPRGKNVRPTSSRVREALFSMMGQSFAGMYVLDLFAGSGILGIEALSRGAEGAVFIERDHRTAAALKQNLHHLGLYDRSVVVRQDVLPAIKDRPVPGAKKPFNAVFADPPYGEAVLTEVLQALVLGGWLAPGAAVAVEQSASEGVSMAPPAALSVIKERTYGHTALTIMEYDPARGPGTTGHPAKE